MCVVFSNYLIAPYFLLLKIFFLVDFFPQNPVLHNGSRDGCIRTCDVRVIGPNWPVMRLNQGELASITCLRVLHDENYLLASGLDGSVRIDLRDET